MLGKGLAYLVQADEPADQVGELDRFPVLGGVEPFLGQMQQVVAELFAAKLAGQCKKYRDDGRGVDFLIQIVFGFLGGIFQPGLQQQIDIFGLFHVAVFGFGPEHGGVLGAVGIFPHQIVRQGGSVVVPLAVYVFHHIQVKALVICSYIGDFFIGRHFVTSVASYFVQRKAGYRYNW